MDEGLERVFHVCRAGWEDDKVVQWMSVLEGSGKKLCGEQGEGVVYGENLAFCVEEPSRGSLHAASRNAEGGVGEPDGSSVDDYGSDDEFVGGDYCFFLLASVSASKSF